MSNFNNPYAGQSGFTGAPAGFQSQPQNNSYTSTGNPYTAGGNPYAAQNGFAGSDDDLALDAMIDDEPLQAYRLLKPGRYGFIVRDVSQKRHEGSGKMAGRNKFTVTIEVQGMDHNDFPTTVTVKDDIFIAKTLAWKISSFLACVGMKKHGEPVCVNACLQAVGRTGEVDIVNEDDRNGKVDNDTGKLRQYNKVQNFVTPESYYGK